MLNSLQNDRYSFIFTTLFVHTTNATISTKNPFFYFSQFSRSYHTVTCSQIIPTIPTNNPLLYTFAISHFHLFACNHPNNLQQKYFPISTICKASFRYSCEKSFFIPQIQKLIYYRCGKPSNLPFFIPSTYCHYFHNLLIPSQELKPKTSDFS